MAIVPVCPFNLYNRVDVRFDWFFKSRTPDELKRRGQTLMLIIMKDNKPADEADFKPTGAAAKGGKKRTVDELKASAAGSRDTTPSVTGKKTSEFVLDGLGVLLMRRQEAKGLIRGGFSEVSWMRRR